MKINRVKKYEIIVGLVVGFADINGFGCSQNSHVFVAIGGFGKHGSYLLKFHTTQPTSTLFDYGM